jgi:high affinity Mn2+ porin
VKLLFASALACLAVAFAASADQASTSAQTNSPSSDSAPPPLRKGEGRGEGEQGGPEQTWNWHVQNTDIVQYHPGFPSKYSGPNSLSSASEIKETVSLDLLVGVRLWPGAEFHLDGLMWQGFGLSKTLGIDGFPNGEAFRLGTDIPNLNFSRVFFRQTIGLGGEQETVEDDQLQLAGQRDVSRLTLTLGRMSAKDIFDNNAYANDSRTQFMNWALMANEAWDYPGDSLGYITGFTAELNQPQWAIRYGIFQMPKVSNGTALDSHFLEAWGMVTEFERRYKIGGHPGTLRLLGFLNHAHMGSYQAALDNPIRPADIAATRAYRYKYGFGLNLEQELAKNIGTFARLGWSDGENEAWVFSDVDRTATLGLSVKGEFWNRPNDTIGIAGVVNGISRVHRDFLAAGGTGILAGDGALTYGLEEILETYYDFAVWKTIHATLDCQFINHPAFNRDRGPVSVFGARLHWSF